MNFESIEQAQGIFKILYSILSYFLIFIVVMVVILNIVNIGIMFSNQYNDKLYKQSNESIPSYNLFSYKWYEYIHSNYNNFSFTNTSTTLYYQPFFLNVGGLAIITVITLGIINIIFLFFMFMLVEDGKSNIADFFEFMTDADTRDFIFIGVLFILFIWIVYMMLFSTMIFEPLKKSFAKQHEINLIINNNIIKNKDVLNNCLKTFPQIQLKRYAKELGTLSETNKRQILFTYYITHFISNSIPTLSKNEDLRSRIVDYLTDPLQSSDNFYGFILYDATFLPNPLKDNSIIFDEKTKISDDTTSHVRSSLMSIKDKLNDSKQKLNEVNYDYYVAFFTIINLFALIMLSNKNEKILDILNMVFDSMKLAFTEMKKFLSGQKIKSSK